MRILIFGDSITQGYFDSHGGWVSRLANDCHQKALKNLSADWQEVFNLGISGNTLNDILGRIKIETKARRLDDDMTIIVVAIGINDSVLINNKVYSEVYKFEEGYEKLVDTVLKLSDKCLFVGLSAVDEELTNPYPSSTTGKQYLNNRINLFEDCIKQVCERKSVPFVPIHDMFIGQLDGKQALLSDGLHPDNAGHSLMYEIIVPEIEKLFRS
ncbi:hypothetical protein H0V99_03850 [Candidatus Saccharibacteria bacterium]|nr:hypothetical protein [Candidatus Saccharibacteria bacterium]